MHRLVAVFCALLFWASAGFSQGTSQTVQVGYAVITPSLPVPSGMLVFENLVETSNLGTVEAGAVVPSNLIVNALLPIDVSRSLLRNVGIAIANPNSGPANVTMTLNNSDGTPRTSTTLTIATRQQIAKLVTELFPVGSSSTQSLVPAEFTGKLLSSPRRFLSPSWVRGYGALISACFHRPTAPRETIRFRLSYPV